MEFPKILSIVSQNHNGTADMGIRTICAGASYTDAPPIIVKKDKIYKRVVMQYVIGPISQNLVLGLTGLALSDLVVVAVQAKSLDKVYSMLSTHL